MADPAVIIDPDPATDPVVIDPNVDPNAQPGDTGDPVSDTGASAASGDIDPDADKKGGLEKRFGELTTKIKGQDNTIARLEGIIQGQAMNPAPVVKDPIKPVKAKLSRNDFNTDDDYLDARDAARDAERKSERAAERAQDAADLKTTSTTQAVAAADVIGRTKHKDYDEITKVAGWAYSQTMFDATSPAVMADVMHALASNPAESQRIAQLPPLQIAKEIGKIEARLSIKPIKTVTNAPAPVKGVGGAPTAPVKEPGDYRERSAEWDKKRRKDAGVKT